MAKPFWNMNQIINQLDAGMQWRQPIVTYQHDGSQRTNPHDTYVSGLITPMSNHHKIMVELAFKTWDDLIPITFQQEHNNNADISFNYTNRETTGDPDELTAYAQRFTVQSKHDRRSRHLDSEPQFELQRRQVAVLRQESIPRVHSRDWPRHRLESPGAVQRRRWGRNYIRRQRVVRPGHERIHGHVVFLPAAVAADECKLLPDRRSRRPEQYQLCQSADADAARRRGDPVDVRRGYDDAHRQHHLRIQQLVRDDRLRLDVQLQRQSPSGHDHLRRRWQRHVRRLRVQSESGNRPPSRLLLIDRRPQIERRDGVQYADGPDRRGRACRLSIPMP